MIFSLTAFMVSVFCQVVLDKKPCELCLISRYIHLLVTAIAAIAIKYHSKTLVRWVVLLLLIMSLGVGLYHLGAENHWWAAPKSCSTVLPSAEEMARGDMSYLMMNNSPKCDEVTLTMFGMSATLLNFFLAALLFWFISVGYALQYGRHRWARDSFR
jgi:disulfide bond formation protein DsbB